MSDELTIYGAAYGPNDVTAKVRSLRKDQRLSFTVNNETFGDTWHGVRKSLVVVYTYAVSHDEVLTAIVEEGDQCVIHPPRRAVPLSPKNRMDCSHHKQIQLASSRQLCGTGQPLVILGAAYGKGNVTQKAKELVSAEGEFNQPASNNVWGDTWHGVPKTLVVVYEYDGLQMLDVVKENERMHFIASPPMTILGAAYGLADVTSKVSELVRNRSLTATANNSTFSDSWSGIPKTLVVTYQYGEELPTVSAVKENETMEIIYSKKSTFLGSTNPGVLTILGAAYGPSDVTQKVQNLVKGSTLQTKVDNSIFSDPWSGVQKSLAIVYRYGRNRPQTKIAADGSEMSIAKVVLPYAGLVDANNLLDDGDILALSTVSGKYLSCDSNNMLVAVKDAPSDHCAMTVQKDSQNKAFKIRCNNGNYVMVNAKAGLALYATGSEQEATMFSISISLKGGLRLATAEGMYVNFDSSDSSLKANSVDQFGAGTIFGIALNQTEDGLSKRVLKTQSILSECDRAWASFIWNLTGGFFLAIGLGPFISTGQVKTGVTGLIQSNPTAWKAIQDLAKAITNGLGRTGALVSSMLAAIGTLYHEGLLWTIFKWMLKMVGWTAITWALAKIIQIVFLPEAEAAQLLASFTVWSVQTVEAGLDVGQACN